MGCCWRSRRPRSRTRRRTRPCRRSSDRTSASTSSTRTRRRRQDRAARRAAHRLQEQVASALRQLFGARQLLGRVDVEERARVGGKVEPLRIELGDEIEHAQLVARQPPLHARQDRLARSARPAAAPCRRAAPPPLRPAARRAAPSPAPRRGTADRRRTPAARRPSSPPAPTRGRRAARRRDADRSPGARRSPAYGVGIAGDDDALGAQAAPARRAGAPRSACRRRTRAPCARRPCACRARRPGSPPRPSSVLVMRRMLGKHEFVRGARPRQRLPRRRRRAASASQLTPERIVAICDRHTGVGSDGILERVPAPAGFDAAVRIYNPDGSEAEKSGNGTRIFAKFCFDHGYVAGRQAAAHAHARRPGRRRTLVAREKRPHRPAHVDGPGQLPLRRSADDAARDEWVQRRSTVGDRSFTATCLSVGNPHAVLFDAPFDEATARKYGPLVENHAQFPAAHQRAVHPACVDRATVRGAHLGARRRLDAGVGHVELRASRRRACAPG